MDTRLKQRLIGAAVLMALAVIFLPMLIGGPEQEAGVDTVPVDVPARDHRRFETRDLTLAPPAPVPTPSAPDMAPVVDESHVATVDTTGAPARIDAVSGAPVGTSPAATPAPAATTPPPASVPAPTPPPAAPVAVPAATASGRWAVNLGSYANASNANALVTQLRQQRLPAYAEQVALNGKSAQRVRLGPFAQRSEAESARLSVQKLRSDLPTSVVSLEGEKSTPPAAKPAPAEGFAVQIGALRTEADANALRDRARAAGFATYVERTNTASGTFWRVRVGPELRRANADRLKGEVKSKLGIDGNVVPHP